MLTLQDVQLLGVVGTVKPVSDACTAPDPGPDTLALGAEAAVCETHRAVCEDRMRTPIARL